jgi:hypothetical protein
MNRRLSGKKLMDNASFFSTHRRPLLLAAAWTLLLALLFLWTEVRETGGVISLPLDDAWIHFQYARNLSQGHGFSYNPGQPTPGSTAPLWTVLLGVFGFFGSSPEWFTLASLLLSFSFLLLTVFLSYGLTFELTGARLPAFLAAIGVATTGRLLWAGLAGMETTAFAAVSLAAVWLYTRRWLSPWTALLLGLGSQLRPEGHALFALVVVDSLWTWWQAQRQTKLPLLQQVRPLARTLILAGLVYGLVAAPYAVFSLATTGKPLPNTFYAKAGSQHFFSLRAFWETIRLHWQDNPVTFLLALGGLGAIWRKSRLIPVWFAGLILLTPIIVDVIWHHGRYTMPLIPFQMILAAFVVWWLASEWPRSANRLTGIALILVLAGGLLRLPHWANMLGSNTREIIQIDVAIGEWVAANLPEDALIAVDDIGAIAFLGERALVDLNGLVSPEMWPAIEREAGMPRDQLTARILSHSRPDYIIAFPLWHWNIVTNPDVSTPVQEFFTPSHTIIGEQTAIVYAADWPYLDEASPQYPTTVTLGDSIQLAGYDLQTGSALNLTLYWRSQAPVEQDYDVFVHVTNENGEIVAQADRQPLSGLAATSIWQPGDIIADPLTIPLPPDLPAGRYEIRAGMFLRASGARLPIPGSENDAYLLETLTR